MDRNKDIKIKVVQYFNGELTGGDIQQVINWKNASKENYNFYNDIKTLLQATNIYFNPHRFNSKKAWNKFVNTSSYKKDNKIFKYKKIFTYLFRVAALLFIVFTIGYITYDLTNAYKQPKIEYAQTIVPNGQKINLLLPDSTSVWLNSGTFLKYPKYFNNQTREVYLEGEAYFDVRENKSKPFIINTSHALQIKVLGTKFNISSYSNENQIETTVIEGSVKVYQTKENQETDNSIILQPNQQATYLIKENKMSFKEVDSKISQAWIYGNYIFKNESLDIIMKKLERAFDIKVYFKDQDIKQIRLSGRFRDDEPIEQVMHIIKITTQIEYSINEDKIYLYKTTN